MKTAIVLEEHLDYFAELDPFGLLKRALFPDRVCLGTVLERKDGGNDVPAALMILHMMEKKVIVEWIFVREELRKRGLGSTLMGYAFKAAVSAGCDRLYLSRDRLPDRDKLCVFEEDFLSDFNFTDEDEHSGEWIFSVEDLLKNPNMAKAAKDYSDTGALKSLDAGQQLKLKKYLIDNDEDNFLYDPAFADEFADPDVSRVLVDEKGIKGTIFVQNSEDDLYVTGLCGKDRKDDMDLCLGATMAASKKYGMDKKVHVIKYNDKDLDLVKDLVKKDPVETSLSSTSVDNYYNALEEFEPIQSFADICSVLTKSHE